MRTKCIWLALALLGLMLWSVSTLSAQTIGPSGSPNDAAWQRYLYVLRSSTLEWLPSEPFLLRVDYQLYDLDGNPAVKGVAEETWGVDGKYIHIESPSLVEGKTSTADKAEAHTRESYLVHQALNALVRPFPSATKQADFASKDFHQTIGDSDVGCFSIIQPGKARTSETHAYCLDPDNHIMAMTGQLFVLERTDFRRYRIHSIPTDMKLSYEGKPALAMHVTELDPLPPSPAATNNSKTSTSPSLISGEVLDVHSLKKKTPSYPKEAKKKHITGSVIIAAIISKQGTVTDMYVIASPDPLLSKSATDAVQTWTYQPFTLNETPTEVETTITVNFNMGR